MTLTIDFTGVEAWKGGGILPPDWHLCQIEGSDDTTESSGGYPQLIVEWSAVEGEHKGLGITEWLVVTDLTRGKIKAFLHAIGIPAEGEVRIEPHMLKGRRALILVREEPDRLDPTKLYSRVKAHERPPGAPPLASPAPIPVDNDIPF